MTELEVKGIERGVDAIDKLVPCLSAVVEPCVERGGGRLGEMLKGQSMSEVKVRMNSNL